MLLRCGLLLLCLNCVRTTESVGSDVGRVDEFNRFSFWPSMHNAARLMRVRREAQVAAVAQSEGGPETVPSDSKSPKSEVVTPLPQVNKNDTKTSGKNDTVSSTPQPASGEITQLIPIITQFNLALSCTYEIL